MQEQDGLPKPRRGWAMLAIAIGIVMAVLDGAIANIALPTIARHLHATPSASVWIVNAYQLTIVVALLPLASLGERIGYRRVYVAGVAVFTVGSLACALSHGLSALVASRILQAVGAAGIMSVNGALVRHIYPLALLGRGVGVNTLIVSMAAALGPTVASSILALAPWPWLFAVNVPFGLCNVVLASVVLPHSARSTQPFDVASAGLSAVMFGLFFVGIDALTQGKGEVVAGLAALGIAVAAAVFLVGRARRSRAPLIPVDLLRIPLFALSVATSIFSFGAYALVFLAMPFFLETVLGRDQVQTGLLMTPWPVAVGVAAPIAGRLADRLPAAVLGGAGLLVLAAGLFCLAELPVHASAADIAWRMALCGIGFGFFQAPNNRTLLASAPRSRAGAAGGMLAVSRLLGMTIGATLAAIMFRVAGHAAETLDLWTATGFALVGSTISVTRLRASRTPALQI